MLTDENGMERIKKLRDSYLGRPVAEFRHMAAELRTLLLKLRHEGRIQDARMRP